jgi:hypothetical protein
LNAIPGAPFYVYDAHFSGQIQNITHPEKGKFRVELSAVSYQLSANSLV